MPFGCEVVDPDLGCTQCESTFDLYNYACYSPIVWCE